VAPDFRNRATPCFIEVFAKIGVTRRFGARRIGAAQHGDGWIVVMISTIFNEIRGWRGFDRPMPPCHPLKARQ